MIFLHINECANPLICRTADLKMLKFRLPKDNRNYHAKYYPVISEEHMFKNIKYWWW